MTVVPDERTNGAGVVLVVAVVDDVVKLVAQAVAAAVRLRVHLNADETFLKSFENCKLIQTKRP